MSAEEFPPPSLLPRATRHKALRITVPENVHLGPTSQSPGLGEPIALSLASLTLLFEYAKIGQLPTPVVRPAATLPTLDVAKRGQTAHFLPKKVSRVLSEFNPARDGSALLPTGADDGGVGSRPRHISNPDNLENEREKRGVASRAHQIPLLPTDLQPSPYEGDTYEAPRLHKTYTFDKVVGTGAFSVVVAAHDEVGSRAAVKIVTIPTDNSETVRNFRLYISRELLILLHLQHPCIVRLLDYSILLGITDDDLDAAYAGRDSPPPGADMYDFYSVKMANRQLFFLGYCPGGNLFAWLSRHHALRLHPSFWRLLARIVAELVLALLFLHHNLVVHRDLKLENVLLTDLVRIADSGEIYFDETRPVCALSDFGLSKRLELSSQLLTTKCGSQDYVSPELLMGLKYDGLLLDAWSFGVLVYAMLEDRLPFDPPPLNSAESGVSPSVIKRRRNRHSSAHRIAMIEWLWNRAAAFVKDDSEDAELKQHVQHMMSLVDAVLVRKEKRKLLVDLALEPLSAWMKDAIPVGFGA